MTVRLPESVAVSVGVRGAWILCSMLTSDTSKWGRESSTMSSYSGRGDRGLGGNQEVKEQAKPT